MLIGILNRQWNGGVMRLASMEGVICGGGFLRLIASPSATISGINSGDVYGGCARVAVVRSYLAVLQYRAAQTATWASAIYNRTATFVVEPVVGSPSATSSPTPRPKLPVGRTPSRGAHALPVLGHPGRCRSRFVPFGIYAIYKLISANQKSRRGSLDRAAENPEPGGACESLFLPIDGDHVNTSVSNGKRSMAVPPGSLARRS